VLQEYLESTLKKKIIERENRKKEGVPLFFDVCCKFILKEGLDKEGIFRLSAVKEEQLALKQALETLPLQKIDLLSFSIHAVCSVIKLFLREQPEPLLGFDLYEPLIDIHRNSNEEEQKQLLLQLLNQKLSAPRLRFLKYLMIFLEEVAKWSEKNRMVSTNLSIVFGPALLRPLNETIETRLNLPTANNIIQIFIENHHLFAEKNE